MMNNIAEGFGKLSNKEFIRYLDTDQSSALEVKSILYVLSDLNYLAEDKVNELHHDVDETRILTLALINLRTKDQKTFSKTNLRNTRHANLIRDLNT